MEMLLRFFSWVVSFFKKKPEPLIVEDDDFPEEIAEVSKGLTGVSKVAGEAHDLRTEWEKKYEKELEILNEKIDMCKGQERGIHRTAIFFFSVNTSSDRIKEGIRELKEELISASFSTETLDKILRSIEIKEGKHIEIEADEIPTLETTNKEAAATNIPILRKF
jgi:signal recognition particle GTPase